MFLCFCHCFAFEFHPPLEVNVTAAEWMRSFHLFALFQQGDLCSLESRETQVFGVPWVSLVFLPLSNTGVAAVADTALHRGACVLLWTRV